MESTKQHRVYQRPGWLTLTAIVLILVSFAVFVVLMVNGYGAFDGRGIIILLVFGLGMWILGSGQGDIEAKVSDDARNTQ